MLFQKLDRWFQKRLSTSNRKTFGVNDVFVFISKEGSLFIILLACTFIAGTNYANNLILGLFFLCVSLLVLSFYLAFRQIYQLSIEINSPDLGQAGQPLPIQFRFIPQNKQIHLHLRCEYAEQAKKINQLVQATDVEFQLLPMQRGLYTVPRFYLHSTYPFAIVRAWSYLYYQREIWIAPQALAVDLQQYGLNNQQSMQGMEDFAHLKEYQQGDAINRIAWQQYAKGRGLLVKQFEQFEQNQIHLHYRDMPALEHEQKLSQLMYLVEQCQIQNRAFSLHLPSQTLAYGQGESHIQHAKRLLAQEP